MPIQSWNPPAAAAGLLVLLAPCMAGTTFAPAPSAKLSETGCEDYLDGIVGVCGRIQLNDRWGLPYYLDVGTGDTDFTWQAFLGASYAFKSVEVLAGYRYLDWEFEDDDPVFNDLNLGGPMVGARWRF